MTKGAWNERVKLLAGLFQSIATAGIGVGLLAPIAALLYNPAAIAAGVSLVAPIGVSLIGIILSHVVAQLILGRVRD